MTIAAGLIGLLVVVQFVLLALIVSGVKGTAKLLLVAFALENDESVNFRASVRQECIRLKLLQPA